MYEVNFYSEGLTFIRKKKFQPPQVTPRRSSRSRWGGSGRQNFGGLRALAPGANQKMLLITIDLWVKRHVGLHVLIDWMTFLKFITP